LISLEAVLYALKQKQDLVLVDVRDSSDFESFRIQGSINRPHISSKKKR